MRLCGPWELWTVFEQGEGVVRLRSITHFSLGLSRPCDLPEATQPQCPGELWLQMQGLPGLAARASAGPS